MSRLERTVWSGVGCLVSSLIAWGLVGLTPAMAAPASDNSGPENDLRPVTMADTQPAAPSGTTVATDPSMTAATDPGDADRVTGTIGLGAAVVPRYEAGDEYFVVPNIPLRLQYKGFQLNTRGLGLELDVIPHRGVDFGPVISFRNGRRDANSRQIAALDEVNPALELGGFLQLNSPPILKRQDSAYVRANVLQDVTGSHEGLVATGSLGYSVAVTPKIRIGGEVNGSLASTPFMRTFYSVSAPESTRSGLGPFRASGGARDVGIIGFIGYAFNKEWGLRLLGGYSRLVGDAADSPITQGPGNANRGFMSVGVTYNF
jgi:MipA family protein